mmetsp:Transcript_29734/g.26316  ORF Transcript_29734/g.26316 Transcript_29734/m.26316 type:complete len:102 (+) Transcript_29734:78-383(+)
MIRKQGQPQLSSLDATRLHKGKNNIEGLDVSESLDNKLNTTTRNVRFQSEDINDCAIGGFIKSNPNSSRNLKTLDTSHRFTIKDVSRCSKISVKNKDLSNK